MRRPFLLPAVLGLAVMIPGDAQGQFFVGGHGAFTDYQSGGAGGGVRLGLDLPVLPLDVLGVAELFSPSCGEGRGGCALYGAGLDANLRLPIPLVRPYVTAGFSYRKGDRGGDLGLLSESGLNMGGGIDFNLGVRIFGDWRWEYLDELEGAVVRVGLNFNL